MSAQETTEVELKYDLDAHAEVPDLTILPAVQSVSDPVIEHLDATYYDTDALDLAGHKITLRKREGGHDEGWHLKRPGVDSPVGRREMHVPLQTAADPFAEVVVPTDLTDHVQVHIRGRHLLPIATISTIRRITELHDAEGAVLAVLCEDSVATQSLLPGGIAQSWHEWELELVSGDTDLLYAADEVLRTGGARTATSVSKLARAIGTTPTTHDSSEKGRHAKKTRLGKKASALELVVAELSEHRDHLIAHDPRVRVNEPDSVHQMRVATRRARSVLRSFPDVLRGKDVEQLEGELKYLASVLGDARDAEVQLTRNRHLLKSEATPAGISRTLIDDQRVIHSTALEAAIEFLHSKRYFELLDELDRTIAEPQPGTDADIKARNVFDKAVAKSAKRVHKAQKKLGDLTDGSTEWVEQLHTIRKRAKQLRYTVDSGARLDTNKHRKLGKKAKRAQSALGDFHDAVISRRNVAQLATGSGVSVADAYVYGRLDAREEAAAEHALAAYKKL